MPPFLEGGAVLLCDQCGQNYLTNKSLENQKLIKSDLLDRPNHCPAGSGGMNHQNKILSVIPVKE